MSKKKRIWQILSDWQPHPAEELIPVSHRFSAIIHILREELREKGLEIKTIQNARNKPGWYQLVKITVA